MIYLMHRDQPLALHEIQSLADIKIMANDLSTGALSGRRIIVTRSAQRAGALSKMFREAGAEVIEIAVTDTVDPADNGQALREACLVIDQYDWVVVTSPEGAHRFREAMTAGSLEHRSFKIAAVGTATAQAVGGADLIPVVQTGRSLGEIFPSGSGRVLLAVAESAGNDFEIAARAQGWTVDRIVTYQTVPLTTAADQEAEIHGCDAITFASASAARAWVTLFGRLTPAVVVAMGPTTATALSELGIAPVTVASEQSLQGLVGATSTALGSR